MQPYAKYIRVCPLLAIIFFLLLWIPDPNDLAKVSSKVRLRYLRQAQVWHRTNIPQADLLAGPQNSISVPPDADVSCHFAEESVGIGFTPKFKCVLMDSGETVRIKYSRRETFAEIAGTRLLWALGFYTDESYPVILTCYDCPEIDPARPVESEKRMKRVIPDAIMERNFDGMEIGRFPDQGWRWTELNDIPGQSRSATKAEIDALKLLAVFIQHSDSKPPQQRLGCYSEDLNWQNGKLICSRPVLMLQDLGATFGAGQVKVGAFSAMYYKGWDRTSIWHEEKEERFLEETGERRCFGRLTSAFDNGLIDPEISEEGRQFLASLLNQLSDHQIRDLFRVARVDDTKETTFIDGRETPVTIEQWVAAFKNKRDQINSRRCKRETR